VVFYLAEDGSFAGFGAWAKLVLQAKSRAQTIAAML
jgi:hypothetical protein